MTPQEIISDEEIARVHTHANFGAMSPREVVNEGVRKTAVGYHCGSTQLHILLEHGLATKPRPGSSDVSLTKKGKAYARSIYCDTAPTRAEALDEGVAEQRDKRAWIDRWNAIEGAAQDALHTMTELLEAPNLKRMQYALSERRDALASALHLPEAGTAWMRPAPPSPTPAAGAGAGADRVRIAVEALEPFARLELPKKPVGNAGAYSLLHADIRRAGEALAALKSTDDGQAAP